MPDPTPTDAGLLARAGTDAGAFRELFDRHAEQVEAFFRRRVFSRDDALDLTAETFAQAWLSRERFVDERGGSAAPWLYGIARNVLRRSARQRGVESRARDRLGMLRNSAWHIDEPASLDESAATLAARLPDGQREAVTLRVIDGMDYAEIAARLGCTETAVRIRVSRGLARLREEGEIDG